MPKWIIWQRWCFSRKETSYHVIISGMKDTQHKRPSAGPQCKGESYLSHLNISPSLSSGWAMKVQLISDSAVHTSRTKARRLSEERAWQQFSNRLRLRKSPWSLKDTQADNGFTDKLVREGIKEMYTLLDRQSCRISLLFHQPLSRIWCIESPEL